jgi:hypothetical protein
MCVSCKTGTQSESEFGLKVTDLVGTEVSLETQDVAVRPTMELV